MQILAASDSFGSFLIGILFGCFVMLCMIGYSSHRRRLARARLPKLAGSTIPELGEGLDLSKCYDITYSGDWNSNFVERLENVRIIGYVGNTNDEDISKHYMRGRWLVAEDVNAKRIYLMPNSIISLRERGD